MPTPTHAPTVHTDPIDRYFIEHPPRWRPERLGIATRIQENEQLAHIEVEKITVRNDQVLVEVAEDHLRRLLTRASTWIQFESRWKQGGINNSGPYLKLIFTRQKGTADCRETGETHIFLSRAFPDNPAAFAITGATCPGSDLEQQELWPYMWSFTEN